MQLTWMPNSMMFEYQYFSIEIFPSFKERNLQFREILLFGNSATKILDVSAAMNLNLLNMYKYI